MAELSADGARASLRAGIRRQRRALDPEARRAANASLTLNIRALGQYRRARNVAIYLACDGEPALDTLIEAASRQGKSLFAPVLHGDDMGFAHLSPGARMSRNSFGILEPADTALIDPRSLDLILTPLVAFDDRGVRLGVGGGYYDRCFRFLRHRRVWFRPKLVGIGYAFQRIPLIEMQSWDVPMWGVVTESGTHFFQRGTTT